MFKFYIQTMLQMLYYKMLIFKHVSNAQPKRRLIMSLYSLGINQVTYFISVLLYCIVPSLSLQKLLVYTIHTNRGLCSFPSNLLSHTLIDSNKQQKAKTISRTVVGVTITVRSIYLFANHLQAKETDCSHQSSRILWTVRPLHGQASTQRNFYSEVSKQP